MINTIEKTIHKSKPNLEHLVNNIYLLPQWEKIKEFALQKKKFFMQKSFNVNLYRKFSSKNRLEKYAIRIGKNNDLGIMDLRVYKDCVYIINIDSYSANLFEQVITKLVQVAVEKALYNTTEKEVKINLSYSLLKQNKMRRTIMSLGFVPEEAQTRYEKEMFGETFTLNTENDSFWQKQIRLMSILINK